MPITPKQFVENWSQSTLREQQGAQSHFNELCELVGHKTPTQADPEGKFFTFEEQVTKATGGKGRVDVWYDKKFAWEYKGKHKDLNAAYTQLLLYKDDLGNPPLLVVCDFDEYRIHPQWPNSSGKPLVFKNEDLVNRETLRYISWLLNEPHKFLELEREELERREAITLRLAYKFADLSDLLRSHMGEDDKPVWDPMRIARFLTKITFVFFAQDVGLLPNIGDSQPALQFIIKAASRSPETFVRYVRELFEAMDGQRSEFFSYYTPYFNGGLFADSYTGADDGLEVLDLTQVPGALLILDEAAQINWSYVNPTIFGTLFEGALEKDKRAQLGAHYTGEADIRLILEPVLMQPLYHFWEQVRLEAVPLMHLYFDEDTAPRAAKKAKDDLMRLHDTMMNKLEQTRVLDPACGSGNFLYVSLQLMKNLEAQVRQFLNHWGCPSAMW